MNEYTTSINPVFLVAAAIGLLLLGIGSYGSYRNIVRSEGAKEKRFAVRACLGTWLQMLLLFVLIYRLRDPGVRYFLVALLVAFPIYVYRVATLRQLIQASERMQAATRKDEEQPAAVK